MKMLPQADFIHVKVEKLGKIGGIAIPDSVTMEEEKITVLAVGPDVKLVKGGERIVPRPMQGIRCIVENQEEIFIREGDILAVMEE